MLKEKKRLKEQKAIQKVHYFYIIKTTLFQQEEQKLEQDNINELN